MTDSKHLSKGRLTYDKVRSVSPALENYTEGALLISGRAVNFRVGTAAW